MDLISFELCPFVQRSVITAHYKGATFDVRYVDLKNKPEWFLEISPLGKVPVLKVGEGKVLFESAVINEYIDEITEGSLLPADPFEKAKMRAYIEFASALNVSLYLFMIEKNKGEQEVRLENLNRQIVQLEKVLTGGDFFNGSSFSLVDTSLAPFLMRYDFLIRNNIISLNPEFKKVHELKESLLKIECVEKSIPGFDDKFAKYIADENLFNHN